MIKNYCWKSTKIYDNHTMVKRANNRTSDEIVADYLSAKARKDFLGEDFVPSEEQLNELKHIVEVFGEHSLSRSRNHKGLSEKTLTSVIPRFLKFNLTNFVDRLDKMNKLSHKNCWEYFVLAYGEEEAKNWWDNKAKNSALSEERLGKDRWEIWLKDRSRSLLEKWTEQYGEEEATKKYMDYRKRLSFCKSIDGYIKKYGEEEGRKKFNERYNIDSSKAYKRYVNKVHRLSQKTYTENIDIINPMRYTRTLCGVENGYQLDHIISIRECFEKGISEEDASSVDNLRMLKWQDNLARNKKAK